MCQVSTYYAFFNEKQMYRKLLIDLFKTDITITKKKHKNKYIRIIYFNLFTV